MKINIIAPNIKSGGGLELLLYLIEDIEKKYPNLKSVVYIDNSLKMIQSAENRRVIHMKSSFEKIKLFSLKIDNSLYFGNLPPLRKSHNSIVYFHNPYLLMSAKKLFSSSLKFFIKYTLQQLYISPILKISAIF